MMKVGDYVRTDTGIIQKIGKIYEQNETNDTHIQLNKMGTGKSVFILDNDKELSYSKGEVIKSSPNIIDLVEVGDYINGLRVEKNKYGELYTSYVYYGGDIGKQCEVYTTWLEEYKENEDYIDSILTKEQFEAMQYKVGE